MHSTSLLHIQSSPSHLTNQLHLRSAPHASQSVAAAISRIRESEGSSASTPLDMSACRWSVTADGSCVAMARGRRLFIMHVEVGAKAKRHRSQQHVSQRSPHVDDFGQVEALDGDDQVRSSDAAGITAMAWIEVQAARNDADVVSSDAPAPSSSSHTPLNSPLLYLLVGWSNGCVGCYRRSGELLFTQRLHSTVVKQIRVYVHRRTRKFGADVLLVHAESVVLVEGRSLYMAIRDAVAASDAAAEGHPTNSGGPPSTLASASSVSLSSSLFPWSFRKWELHEQTCIEDATLCEPLPSLQPFDFGMHSASSVTSASASLFPLVPNFVAVGSEPMIALYAAADDLATPGGTSGQSGGTRSTRGAIKLVASKLGSAVFSMAKSWWNSDTPAASPGAGADDEQEAEAPIPQGEALDFEQCIRDGARQILSIAADPLPLLQAHLSESQLLLSGCGSDSFQSLSVTSDNFGRVMLLDLSQCVLVRMWKGYRDAQCLLIRQLVDGWRDSQTTGVQSAPAAAAPPPAPSPSVLTTNRPAKKSKSSKSKLSIVQQPASSHETKADAADDVLKDFDSLSISSSPASSQASRSDDAQLNPSSSSSSRVPVPALHLLLYAPRRGQLELWSLPYGGRIGARNVGLGCQIVQASYGAMSSDGVVEVSAIIIRANGQVNTIHMTAPVILPTAEAEAAREAEAAAQAAASAEETLLRQLECDILEWSSSHECEGFSCGAGSDTFQPLLSQLQQLEQCIWKRMPTQAEVESDSKQSSHSEMLLGEAHVARLATLLSESAQRLAHRFSHSEHHSSSSSASSSPSCCLCPRLCESLLQGVLHLLSATLTLATPAATLTSTQIKFDDAEEETTVTVTQERKEEDRVDREALQLHLAGSKQIRVGRLVYAKSDALLSAELLKATAEGWLHLLAAYHTSCAPGGSFSAASASAASTSSQQMTLMRFLDAFRVRVEDIATEHTAKGEREQAELTTKDKASTAVKKGARKNSVPPSALPSSAAEIPHPVADPPAPLKVRRLRFTLSPSLRSALSNSSIPLSPTSPLLPLSRLLFGPTSSALLPSSDFIASRSLDLLLHLEQAPFDRRTLVQIMCASWITQIEPHTLESMADPEHMQQAREQLQMLVQAMIAPMIDTHADAASTPSAALSHSLSHVVSFLSTTLRWCFCSSQLQHVSLLLRFIRSWVILPQQQLLKDRSQLHVDQIRDGDTEMDKETQVAFTESLQSASSLLSLLDASSRVLFRHACQLHLLRSNFPASTIPLNGVLSQRNFLHSHPLSRLVAMHMCRGTAAGTNAAALAEGSIHGEDEVRSKDELVSKLRAFESVLAAGNAEQEAEAAAADDLSSMLTVATLQAVRAARDDSAASMALLRSQLAPVAISAWDWKFTSDDASCCLFATLQSIQHLFAGCVIFASSSVAPSVRTSLHLLSAVSYLEYAPHSAVSGGLAVWIWQEILEPHLRALVHVAYPDGPNSLSATTGTTAAAAPASSSASAANVTAAHAAASAAAAAKSKKPAPTFLTLLKSIHNEPLTHSSHHAHALSSNTHFLFDCSNVESLRALLSACQRTLLYLSQCFEREHKDESWEGGAKYLCPAIAQTIQGNDEHAIPIRVGDDRANAAHIDAHLISDAWIVDPSKGPPPPANASNLCTSLFHTHVRYVHPESSASYANVPSQIYKRLCSFYEQTHLDDALSDLLRLVETVSAHVELDVSPSLLAAQRASIGHMFPNHTLIRGAQAFKSFLPQKQHIFPTITLHSEMNDLVEGICRGTQFVTAPPTPAAPTSSGVSRAAAPLALVQLAPTPSPSARLQFLMCLLKDRPALTTAPIVFGLVSPLSLSASATESLLREHVVLLYERGEDTRAWECAPRLEDQVCMATIIIGVGRTRLGLFLHALEQKHSQKYAQLVSAVPAQAWQWLSKAKPPLIVSRVSIGGTADEALASPAGSSIPGLLLSGFPSPRDDVHAPLHLILFRLISIKQKAGDIDAHATSIMLKRAKSILEHAVATGSGHASAASQRAAVPAVAVAAPAPIQGTQFGFDGDNSDATRITSPIRYARAYCSQLCDIIALVMKGIGARP